MVNLVHDEALLEVDAGGVSSVFGLPELERMAGPAMEKHTRNRQIQSIPCLLIKSRDRRDVRFGDPVGEDQKYLSRSLYRQESVAYHIELYRWGDFSRIIRERDRSGLDAKG